MDHPGATISLASITNPRARSRSRDGRFIDEPKQSRPSYGDSRESSYVYPDDDLRSPRGSGGHLPYPDDDKLKYLPQKYGRRFEDEDNLAYGLPPPHSGRSAASGHRSSQSMDLRKHSDSDRDDSRSHRRSNTLTVDAASRDRSRSRSRDGRSGRDRSPQPPTGRMSTLTVNTGRGASLSLASAPASPLLESYHGTYQNCSPMPSPLLLASKHAGDLPRVVDALSPISDGEGDGTRLNRRARFHDTEDISSRLARALKGTHKPDVAPFIEILPSLSHEQVMELRSEYKHIVKTGTDRKGVNIAKHIRARFKDEDPLLMKACYTVALGKWESEAYWANFWYQGDKTRRELLIESLMGRTNEEIRHIKDSFSDKKYDNSLTKCMKTELKEDKFKKAVLMVLDERRMEEYDYEGRRLPLDYKLIDQDVDDLHKAVKSEKGGETMMISIVVQRSDGHLRAVLKEYEHQYRSNFARDALKKSNNLVGELLAHILNGVINRPVRDALLLQHAITASRKDSLRRELLISRLVRFHWDSFHMQDVKRAYRERYGLDLQDAVREATSGEWGMFCRELCIARMPNEIRRMENTR
ncbi:Annexin [Trichoderma velutinum]